MLLQYLRIVSQRFTMYVYHAHVAYSRTIIMRISINAGSGSSVTLNSASNNLVFDSASIIPDSLIQLDDINNGIADKSASPAVLTELAQVDLSLDHNPSMMEIRSQTSKGFLSKFADYVRTSKIFTSENDMIDLGGSRMVFAFGKLGQNAYFLEKILPDEVQLLTEGIELFNECFSTYDDKEKRVFSDNEHNFKGRSKCLFNVHSIPFSLNDIVSVLKRIDRAFGNTLTECYKGAKSHPTTYSLLTAHLDDLSEYQSTLAVERSRNKHAEKANDTGYDLIVGNALLSINEQLLNVATCDMFKKCPNELGNALDSDFDKIYKVNSIFDVRAVTIDHIQAKTPSCGYSIESSKKK